MRTPKIHLMLVEAQRHFRAGKLEAAEEIGRQIVKLDREDVDARHLLALIAVRDRRYHEAVALYHRCIKASPRNAQYPYLLGKAYIEMDQLDDSIKMFDAALRIDRDYVPAINWKARVLERQGRRNEANTLIGSFVNAGTETDDMAEVDIRNKMSCGEYDAALAMAQKHLNRDNLPHVSRHVLSFLKAQTLDQAAQYEQAFEAFKQANAVLAVPFNRAEHVNLIDRLIETFSVRALGVLPRSANDSQMPVFIAGMPRSGTTLVEQIIDAHPQAQGVGEITDIEDLADCLPELCEGKSWPEAVRAIEQRPVEELASRYLQRLRALAPRAERVVNKSLKNYWNLGLIAMLFPKARVIFCRRDPLDNCISCFMNELMPGPMPWASDLADCGFAYRQHERLMDHWKSVLPLPILEIEYGQMIEDQGASTRAIIEFLDLPWDDRCLDFHKSGRTAMTLSYEQVRQPIYRSALGRYRNYDPWIGPLRAELAPSACNGS